MRIERRLVIDIGTNSVLALLAVTRGDDIEVLRDEKATTRLGEGLVEAGRLSAEAMERTAEAVAAFTGEKGYDRALLIGTQALRTAANSEEFADMIFRRTGEKITIVSGEKEATLSFIGALYDLPEAETDITVIDVGGGSTEIARGDREGIDRVLSIPVGAARLPESSRSDTLKACVKVAHDMIVDEPVESMAGESTRIVAAGGTVTSLAAMIAGQEKYDPGSIHGHSLSVEQMRKKALEFEGLPGKERENLIPFDPLRADLILPGAGIIISILGILGRAELTVSAGGLRYGAAIRPDLLGI